MVRRTFAPFPPAGHAMVGGDGRQVFGNTETEPETAMVSESINHDHRCYPPR